MAVEETFLENESDVSGLRQSVIQNCITTKKIHRVLQKKFLGRGTCFVRKYEGQEEDIFFLK